MKPTTKLFLGLTVSACIVACAPIASPSPANPGQLRSFGKISQGQPLLFVVNGKSANLSAIQPQQLQQLPPAQTIALPMNSYPHHAYISPDKRTMAVSLPGMDFSQGHSGHGGMVMPGQFALIDLASGEALKIVKTPSMNHNANFSPNGQEIWTAGMTSNKLYIFDRTRLTLKKEIAVGKGPAEVTFSSNGQRAFVANGSGNSVTVLDVSSAQVLSTISVGENPVGAWPGADGRMYVDNEESKTISVLNAETLKVEETVSLGFTPGMAAFHPSLQELWVSNADAGAVVIFKRPAPAAPFQQIQVVVTGKGAHAIVFDLAADRAYITNQGGGTISVLNAKDKRKLADIPVQEGPNGLALLQ